MNEHAFSSSLSSLKKKAALCALKSGPRSRSSPEVANIGGCPGLAAGDCAGLLRVVCDAGCGEDWIIALSVGRTPNANAAASEAGRLAANDEIIFFKNL